MEFMAGFFFNLETQKTCFNKSSIKTGFTFIYREDIQWQACIDFVSIISKRITKKSCSKYWFLTEITEENALINRHANNYYKSTLKFHLSTVTKYY